MIGPTPIPSDRATLAVAAGHRMVVLEVGDVPTIQQFYEANPEYSVSVMGRPPQPRDADDDFHDPPPAEFSWRRQMMLGFVDKQGELIGISVVVADLFATAVWHIGYFMVATQQHGTGIAAALYTMLEGYARHEGAHWLRLGVVLDNRRAARFWEKCGYHEVRQREGYVVGDKTHVVRVMVKPVATKSIDDYLAVVARDRLD